MVTEIAPQTGTSFTLTKGQILRVIDPLGEQVADLTAFSLGKPRSWLSSGKSIDFAGKIYLSVGDILYSNLSEPMFTIVKDTVGRHDFLLAPCSQETFDILYPGHSGPHRNCLSNLTDALGQYGIGAPDIPVTFNLFMNVTVSPSGAVHIDPPSSKPGDYIDLRAEMDVIVGLTACSAEKTNNFKLKPIQYQIFWYNK